MRLVTMHKIFIGTAITGGALFSAWSVYSWSKTGASSALVIAVVSATITVFMGLYLRNFIRKNPTKEAT